MVWIHWVIITLASSAGVGLVVRHLTTTAITHAFQVEMEKLKHSHLADIERIKGEVGLELEYVKAEIALFANEAASEVDKAKSLHMQVANVRATSYPKLVAILRRMKLQFEGLARATDEEVSGGRPINLSRPSKRAELVKKAIAELTSLAKEFDNQLSNVRLFTTRSYYSLQDYTDDFCDDWDGKGGIFTFGKEQLRRAVDAYNDDIALFSEEFYRPEIPITDNSGERLGIVTGLPESLLKRVEQYKSQPKKLTDEEEFIDWLRSRRPGTSLLHKSCRPCEISTVTDSGSAGYPLESGP